MREHGIFTRHITAQLEICSVPAKIESMCCDIFEKNSRTWENAAFLCEHHLRENNRVSKGDYPLGSGFPIGASSTPVGTRFSAGKSSVLYLCGADDSRNCSIPRKVWLQLRRFDGKGCPLWGSMSDRKKLAGGANMHCLPALSSAEQRYIKAPVSRCLPSYQNHHAASHAAVHRLALHLLCPALAQMEMECHADQRVLDSIGKSIAVQKIGLLSGGQLVHRRI